MKDGFIRVGACSPKIRLADVKYNADLIIDLIKKADKECIRLLTFPELCLTGASCGGLFLHENLLDEAEAQIYRIAEETKECKLISIIGAPLCIKGRLCDCAAVIACGQIRVSVKQKFPNCGELNKEKYFSVSDVKNEAFTRGAFDSIAATVGAETVFALSGYKKLKFGIAIGDDAFSASAVPDKLADAGALIIVNCAADAELAGKAEKRKCFAKVQSEKNACAYIYCGAGEGESTADAVCSGHCFIYEAGELLAERKPFSGAPEILITEIDLGRLEYERRARMDGCKGVPYDYLYIGSGDDNTYNNGFCDALPVLSFHRKFRRNPFLPEDKTELNSYLETILAIQSAGLKRRIEHIHAKCAVLGISGGLDSSLALIAAANTCDLMGVDRSFIKAYTMPCFGTTEHTKNNAVTLCEALGAECKTIPIADTVLRHFRDIGHDETDYGVVYENAQARMRTLVLMDIANKTGGLVIGTGDLSEQALGWATYNGDHMSMYGLNAGVPKTVIRALIRWYAEKSENEKLKKTLFSILDTPVSPELLPAKDGEIAQITEDLVGPYELHDFFLYYVVRWGYPPAKLYRIAKEAFKNSEFNAETILKWLGNFYRRFFSQQFKRDCMPDGPAVCSVSLSPRAGFVIPSDAAVSLWLDELNKLE